MNEEKKKKVFFLFNHNQELHWIRVFYVADRIGFVNFGSLDLNCFANANRNHGHANSEPK